MRSALNQWLNCAVSEYTLEMLCMNIGQNEVFQLYKVLPQEAPSIENKEGLANVKETQAKWKRTKTRIKTF